MITKLDGIELFKDLAYSSEKERLELLQTVLMAGEEDAEDEFCESADNLPTSFSEISMSKNTTALNILSGGNDMAYLEKSKK